MYVRDGAPTEALLALMRAQPPALPARAEGGSPGAEDEARPPPKKKPAVARAPARPREPSPPRVRQPAQVLEGGWVVVPNK